MSEQDVRTIRFGLGEVVSTPGTSNGFPAVIIEPADIPGMIGADANYGKDLRPMATILEIHGVDGIRVFLEDIKTALERAALDIPFTLK
jgi:hypothetical protein